LRAAAVRAELGIRLHTIPECTAAVAVVQAVDRVVALPIQLVVH
tara:strand:- start:270 stop:401 length:132 start_codon:yes stop_codon:yes gene_type:complete